MTHVDRGSPLLLESSDVQDRVYVVEADPRGHKRGQKHGEKSDLRGEIQLHVPQEFDRGSNEYNITENKRCTLLVRVVQSERNIWPLTDSLCYPNPQAQIAPRWQTRSPGEVDLFANIENLAE